MKLYRKEDATIYANSDVCKNLEYNVDDKAINFSVATINGRYPSGGVLR